MNVAAAAAAAAAGTVISLARRLARRADAVDAADLSRPLARCTSVLQTR